MQRIDSPPTGSLFRDASAPSDHLPSDIVAIGLNESRWTYGRKALMYGNAPGSFMRVVRRLLREGCFGRVFARFDFLRRTHSIGLSFVDKVSPSWPGRLTAIGWGCIRDGLPPVAVSKKLAVDGYFSGFRIPASLVDEIKTFAETESCRRFGFDDPETDCFPVQLARGGRLPDGRLVSVANVNAPQRCAAVQRLALDPSIIDIFRRRYGYRPRRVHERLYWNLALSAGHPAREYLPNNGGRYHYDTDGVNGLYVFIYLTNVDRQSGPHVVIPGSHRRKTWSMRLGSRYRSDEEMDLRFGADAAVAIEGGAGVGFVEDPAIIHKYLVPVLQDRLVLQLRYS